MTVPAATAPESTHGLLASAARAWPDAVAAQWIPCPAHYARCQAWTYAELAGTVTRIANGLARLGIGREDAVTLCGLLRAAGVLLEWAAKTIGAPAARPKRIYAIPAISLTAVGKQFKPALAAAAARRVVARALDRAGVSAGEITVAPAEAGLAANVAAADPGQVQSALGGLPLTVRASRRCDQSGGKEQPR